MLGVLARRERPPRDFLIGCGGMPACSRYRWFSLAEHGCSFRRTSLRRRKDFTAPLEFQNVPQGYFVEDAIPRDAVLTLEGQDSDFNALNPQALNVSVNIGSSTSAGWHTIALTEKDVDAPLNFSVVQVQPQSVEVEIVKD